MDARKKANAKATDDAAHHHHSETSCKSLDRAAKGKDHRANEECAFPANYVAYLTSG
jgi:hypothetical protein